MTVPISTVVQVNISRNTLPVTQKGFGVPLIHGPNGSFLERSREYNDLTGVTDDFLTTEDEYKAAAAIFSQEKRPERIRIAKQDPKVAQVDTLDFDDDFVASNVIDFDIEGVAQTPVNFNADHATTLSDLAAAIQGHALIATASVTGARQITITAQTAGIPFTLSNVLVTLGASQPVATIANTTPNHGIVEDLILAQQENNDWYGLVITSRVQAEVELVAAWVETQKKIFLTASNEANILDPADSTDIASVLNSKNYTRSASIYNGVPGDFIDGGWFGRMLPENPGSATWKFKTVVGSTADNLTPTQRSAALGKNANLLSEIGGRDMMEEGKMANGEYIDIIRGVDWIQARMEENVFKVLADAPKVPFTDAGIGQIESPARATLSLAKKQNVIESFIVNVPKKSDVPIADVSNRNLNKMTWTAVAAGAIHKVIIEGTITL